MAVFITTKRNHVTQSVGDFSLNPVAVKALGKLKGWLIYAYSTGQEYGGTYNAAVGYADQVETGFIAFRTKRDAVAAMKEAIDLGILKVITE